MATVALLSGCAVQNKGIDVAKTASQQIDIHPLEANVEVGRKMTGRAKCTSLFGFSLESPKKRAYGSTIETAYGNIAPSACSRGAVYNALSKSKSDLIIAPQYEVDDFSFLCIPFTGWCVYRTSDISVTGYEGYYTNIREIPIDIIRARQLKNEPAAPKTTSSGMILF